MELETHWSHTIYVFLVQKGWKIDFQYKFHTEYQQRLNKIPKLIYHLTLRLLNFSLNHITQLPSKQRLVGESKFTLTTIDANLR